ncbi:hypothetical protein SUGI_0275890 [Cryptomeria japonica]|uniref:trihelix transcription factor GTL1 n=1 Tax=Cryptomeria japonica TaxID=3369 RepID=UPI002408972C|nr:trihelix transcription factor GTL1 [Cryptomeria japonica]GLJ16326.1 hypothetical protein SUGI_0275890 [Cryptomeria japonica]
MQASGGMQYGVAEASQFMVGRGPPSHNMLSSSSSPRDQRPYCSRSEQEEKNPRNLQQQQHLNVQMVGMGTEDPPPPHMVDNHTKQGEGEANYSNSGGGDDDVFGGEVECERGGGVGVVCTGNRWPRQETLALLKIRSEMDASFRDSSLKGPLWEHVSRRLEELGYHRDPKKCKEKFENLHKYYKRTKEGRTGRQDGKSYRFFSQLEALYANNNNKINGPLNTVTPVSNGDARISDAVNSRSYNDDNNNNKNNIGMGGSFTGATTTADPNFSEAISFSSDSSEKEEEEEEYDEPRDSYSRKRKRSNSKKKMMALFEKMMKQMMEKQERMQQIFLEAIEKREQDRAIREETWRRKEIARLNRDEELRSQERSLAASRDLALVSFLQKFTGQTFSLDPQLMHPHHDQEQEHEQEINVNYKDLNSSVDPNSKRWPKPEVLALIRIRSGMNNRFQESGPKSPLWEEISAQMASLGYNRSAKRCKEKWENINKYYKKAKESNKRRPENAKTCPYFHQLDALYRRAMLNNPNKLISLHDEDIQDHQEELLGQASGSNREESAQGHGGDGEGELLVIMPPPDSDTALPQTPTSNASTVPTFFSNPQNPSAEEGSLTKGVKQQNGVMDEMQSTPQRENQSAGEGNSGHQMKTIQISVMNNLQDHEKQKHGEQLHSSTARDSSFMEIVQKLTAGPPEFKLSSF